MSAVFAAALLEELVELRATARLLQIGQNILRRGTEGGPISWSAMRP